MSSLTLEHKKTNKKMCAFCQFSATKSALEVHHMDGNHDNNDPSNLMVLCTPCHREAHERHRDNINYSFDKLHKKSEREQIDRLKVGVNGGSLYVRLPKMVCNIMGIAKNTTMNVYRKGGCIIFEKEATQQELKP